MKRYANLIFILIIMGCTNTTPDYQEKKKSDTVDYIYVNSTRPVKELIPLVLNGDTDAYYELYIAYYELNPSDFLPYALLMANKYDYDKAYYDVFDRLTLLYWKSYNKSISLDSLDNQTRKMALDYLKKGAEKGEYNSLRDLGWLYLEGKHVKKDTILGNQLLEKARNK